MMKKMKYAISVLLIVVLAGCHGFGHHGPRGHHRFVKDASIDAAKMPLVIPKEQDSRLS